MKHFLANSNENDRDKSSSDFDERLFHEYYSLPFRMGVVEGGSRAYMAAYNAVNKVPMTINPILQKITREEWGQDGIICTDAGAMRNLVTAHILAAERLVEGSPVPGSAYFITDDQPMNHGEMSRRLARVVGMLPKVRYMAPNVLFPIAELSEIAYERFGKKPLVTKMQCRTCLNDYYFSAEAAKRDLGYAPISTDEGIASCRADIEGFLRSF